MFIGVPAPSWEQLAPRPAQPHYQEFPEVNHGGAVLHDLQQF